MDTRVREETTERTKVTMSLSLSQSLTLAAVLRECSDQLDILGYALIVQINREEGSAQMARLTKLKRDCQFISQHISELYSELEEEHTFTSLQKVVEKEEQKAMQRGDTWQKEREEKLKNKDREITQKSGKLEDMKQLLKDLRQEVTAKASEVAHKKEYAALIAKANELRLQERQVESSETEKKLEEHLEVLQKQIQQEMLNHEASVTFLQHRNKELQQQLSQWHERSGQMLKEKEQKLNKVQCDRTINADRLMEKRRLFTEMEQVVLEDREKMKKLQQQQEEVRAATKLQAWWRGCMVRHGLSGFGKPEEVKKGKKKKTGGKGKKKK
ncbi:dynein regulatory complex protein 9 isoform X2 [Halichoeres trimaculatus]|uniref:dynein regulatory complex protein 9 isoform X2 n=1 Tax=Halichoeres trimaculatus TaxID=147232 RepID=UPI003D9EA758